MRQSQFTFLFLLSAASCSGDGDKTVDSATPTETDADTDSDTDSDTDADTDSDTDADTDTDTTVYAMGSCAQILAADSTATSGVYQVDPTGSGPIRSIYCDMDSDGGGWTLSYLSSHVATDKIGLDALIANTGTGDLATNDAMYAISDWTTGLYTTGASLRVTWLCGTAVGPVDLVMSGPSVFADGATTWNDDRDAATVSTASVHYHSTFSGFSYTGTVCHGGQVRDDFVYGFAFGNGDGFGQYTGMYDQYTAYSTAISDQAYDNTPGSVAGWIR